MHACVWQHDVQRFFYSLYCEMVGWWRRIGEWWWLGRLALWHSTCSATATPAGTSAHMSAATRPQRSCTTLPKLRGQPVTTNPPFTAAANTPTPITRVTRGSCTQHAAAAAASRAGRNTPATPLTPQSTPPMESTRVTRYSCKHLVGAEALGAGCVALATHPVSRQQRLHKRGLMDEDCRTLLLDVTFQLLWLPRTLRRRTLCTAGSSLFI